MQLAKLTLIFCFGLIPYAASAQSNPSPCFGISVEPNPAKAGQPLLLNISCHGCRNAGAPTTTVDRDGLAITVVSRVPGFCVDGVSQLWEFNAGIGHYLPGEYSVTHVFESFDGPFDPVVTGFVVEAQAVPASGKVARTLGGLAILVLGMGMLWRTRRAAS